MKGIFSWNGKSSDQFGIIIEEYPRSEKPRRKIETYSIPGRNGDIIMAQDAWENAERSYEILFGVGGVRSIEQEQNMITEWICGPAGYCELWDDFDQGYYRLACLSGGIDFEPLALGRAGKAKITFNCKPQRYLISGKAPVSYYFSSNNNAGTLQNTTSFASKPLIYVNMRAAGNGTVTMGDYVFTLTDIPAGGLYIDCEEMKCYDENNNNMNSKVASSNGEFATIKPGKNNIGATGNVSEVKITPRWFII